MRNSLLLLYIFLFYFFGDLLLLKFAAYHWLYAKILLTVPKGIEAVKKQCYANKVNTASSLFLMAAMLWDGSMPSVKVHTIYGMGHVFYSFRQK